MMDREQLLAIKDDAKSASEVRLHGDDFRVIIDLALKGLDEWSPTHRNKRTGAICQLVREDISNETVTEFDEVAVLYVGADGTKYVTGYDDFFDGLFEPLPTPPKEGGE